MGAMGATGAMRAWGAHGAVGASRGIGWTMNRWLKPAVFVLSLGPVVYLAVATVTGGLGVNPAETLQLETGIWALRFLLVTLAITPLRRITGWHRVIQYRRMLGLFAFFYATLHLA